MGLDADGDNEPASESMPQENAPQQPSAARNAPSTANGLEDDQSWGWPGIDCRKDYFKAKPQAVGISRENACAATASQWLSLFLGWPIINLATKRANKNLPPENPMGRREFLRFLGLWMLMSAIDSGFDKMEHWSTTIPSPETGAPFRFNEWMSRN